MSTQNQLRRIKSKNQKFIIIGEKARKLKEIKNKLQLLIDM